MTALDPLEAILARPRDEDEEPSAAELIEELIPALGWEVVRDAILELLATERPRADYQAAAELLWWAVLDGRELPTDRVIALLYHRFDPRGDAEDNLVWSITSSLKGVGYLSSYRPLEDPGVRRALDALGDDGGTLDGES